MPQRFDQLPKEERAAAIRDEIRRGVSKAQAESFIGLLVDAGAKTFNEARDLFHDNPSEFRALREVFQQTRRERKAAK
jgi:hypothetical protein